MEKEEITIFDKILDENNSENIVLYNEKNEPVEFEQIAYIPIEEKDYAILRPVKPLEGLKDDEALVFELIEEEDSQNLIMITDDAQIDAVFAEYNKLFDSIQAN
jgi:hypothetical protein